MVENLLALQKQNDIITLLLEGKEEPQITPYIVQKYKISKNHAVNCVSNARITIKERKLYEVPVMVPLHIQRYEEIYEKLYELNAHAVAMIALKAKEKLLNFHKDNFHMRVSSGEITQVGVQNIPAQYEIMKLGDKRRRLQELMEKAKSK